MMFGRQTTNIIWAALILYLLGILFFHVVPTGGGGDRDDESRDEGLEEVVESPPDADEDEDSNRIEGIRCIPCIEIFGIRLGRLFHLMMFLPWGGFVVYFARQGTGLSAARFLFWVGLGVLVAAVAEGIQYWIPYRSFNWTDILLNVSGVLMGTFFGLLFYKRR